MQNELKKLNMKSSYAAILIILAAAYLGLWRLDNTVFWEDETDIAIVARNFLKFGWLTSWDGRNLLAATNGGALDENLRPRMPPLGYLVGAVSFKLLGISAWSGRFPFVLAGLGSLVLLAVALREDFGKDSPLWIYGIAAMGFSVSFLLNIRQCRYYSLTMLFSMLTFILYRRCLNTGRLIYFVLLSLAAILLFYSNFLLCAAFLAALVLVCAVFHGGKLRKDWLKFCIAGGLFVLATVPYSVYYRIWYRPDIIAREIWYVRKLTLIWWNFRDLKMLEVMPWMGAIGLFCFMVYYWKKQEAIRVMLEWVVLIGGCILFLSLLSPQTPKATRIADLRYFASLIPFLAGATGMFLWFIHQRTKVGAFVCFALIITTNLLNIPPTDRRFQWLLPAYVNEIHHNYPTAYGEVVRFLRENAQQDDAVFAWPECTNFPLMFYLGEKVKMSCLLDADTTLPPAKIRELNAPLLAEENFPDWIILFRLNSDGKEILDYFSRAHIEEMREVQFNYRQFKLLDVYGVNTTRPELPWHSFVPVTDFQRETDAVYVFKKSIIKEQ
jgi:4-amino-4-deoxy-L-arabinose transferase-like glycosyltransferase